MKDQNMMYSETITILNVNSKLEELSRIRYTYIKKDLSEDQIVPVKSKSTVKSAPKTACSEDEIIPIKTKSIVKSAPPAACNEDKIVPVKSKSTVKSGPETAYSKDNDESKNLAGKAFVESVKHKTDEQLDEDVKMENEPKQEDPTLLPAENFNAESDAQVLHKAMKGFGTDEKAIISILGKRTRAQRKEIASQFVTLFGKQLDKELSSELSGNFKTLCVESLLGPSEFDAKQLNKAIKGLGTDETTLVEIICSRTNQELNDIKAAYKTMFKKELEADVVGDTSGWFKRLLVGCLQANRPEGTEFDRNKAKQDAQDLFAAGEKKLGTDESKFQVVMVARSFAQLRATFQEYAKAANKDIEATISSEMSGDVKDGMLAVVRVIRNKSAYFAKQLHKSMKGLGTDDDTLVRVVNSRCEVDMVQIKEEFQKEYKQTLAMFIKDDTSGDYRKMLLTLIGEESQIKK